MQVIIGAAELRQLLASAASDSAETRDVSGWVSVNDRLPPFDTGERVLIYTEGVDFAGEQFFDIKADDLYPMPDGEQDARTEVAAAATHWMPLPRPIRGIATFDSAETREPATAIEWEPLPEDAYERASFNRNLDLYGGDPRLAVAGTLGLWGRTMDKGSFGKVCCVLANEVAKMHLAPVAAPAATRGQGLPTAECAECGYIGVEFGGNCPRCGTAAPAATRTQGAVTLTDDQRETAETLLKYWSSETRPIAATMGAEQTVAFLRAILAAPAQGAVKEMDYANSIIAKHFSDDPANACRAHAAVVEILAAPAQGASDA